MSGSLAQKMAGEIVFSENPGETLKKWREIFGLTQKGMADLLEINPSVVCDFEKGRRDSPGIKTVKRYILLIVVRQVTCSARVYENSFWLIRYSILSLMTFCILY